MKTRLKIILKDVRAEIEEDKRTRPVEELKAMIMDAAPVRSFSAALRQSFGLIAEIKLKSPSAGPMRSENVRDTVNCYQESEIVHAVSVLTNKHFGMSIESLARAKKDFSKPILRKDFILDEYQIYQARAFGADAVLLMGNIGVPKKQLHRLWQVATSLGLDVLFESHTPTEIKNIPSGATIYGINCRLMDSIEETSSTWIPQKLFRMFNTDTDVSRFNMIRNLPPEAVKVAESGIYPNTVRGVKDRGYDAALVGTALLTATDGLQSALNKFEEALALDAAKTDGRWLTHATA
jgi:indole-3-glycerol phosphate synthase